LGLNRLLEHFTSNAMSRASFLRWSSIALILLSSCNSSKNIETSITFESFISSANYRSTRDQWTGAALSQYNPKRSKLVILTEDQRARLYINDIIAIDFPICTGTDDYPTPKGSFKITQKVIEHRSNLYGSFVDGDGNFIATNIRSSDTKPKGTRYQGARMPYWMRFNGAIGIHEGLVYREESSHGCVRVTPEAAPVIYEKLNNGSTIIVK